MPKLMTWNILHGGGAKRMPAIILELVEQAADVVVVTEYRTTTGGQLRGIMADHGWEHQICSDPPPRSNGVLIASRFALKQHSTSRLHIEAELPDLELSLVGLHIPCKGGSTARNSLWKETLAIARRRAEEPCVLIGDFNTGRHFLDEEGATFRQTANLGHLSALGYADAWREIHANRREASWFSHEGQGFRLDHAFVSNPLLERVTDAQYEQRTRKTGLSDHASLSVTLAEH